jgi:hypothetical protein
LTPKIIIAETATSETAGYLYFETDLHIVLLNHVASQADLGPLRGRRLKFLEHEADIAIIPRSEVTAMHVLREPR